MIHELTIVPAPKMDTPSLVAARCSCGYRSGSATENEARKSWQQHVDAKLAQAFDELGERFGDAEPRH